MDPLTSIVRHDEILTSSTLISRLTHSGKAYDSARQILRRSWETSGLWRSEKLILPRGERLFCHKGFRGKANCIRQATALLNIARPGIARCLNKILGERVLMISTAAKLLASPIISQQSNPYPCIADELEAICEIGSARVEHEGTSLGHITNLADSSLPLAAGYLTSVQMETHFTRIIVEQFRRQGVISWEGTELSEPKRGFVPFNNFAFSGIGYSYLAPLLRSPPAQSKRVPCPVLFDVIARKGCLDDVESFLQRIKRATIRGSRAHTPVGVLAAPKFSDDAFDLAKKNGLWIMNLEQTFGDVALEALGEVEELLKRVSKGNFGGDKVSTERFAELLKDLSANPLVVELRSLGFETWAGLLMRGTGDENVELNAMFPFRNTERDVDVLGWSQSHNVARLVECKAYKSTKAVSPSDVTKFFTEVVPAFLRVHGSAIKTCNAEIWTTGIVDQETKNALSRLALKNIVQPAIRNSEELKKMVPPKLKRIVGLIDVIGEA
jgi:hypothetical protein